MDGLLRIDGERFNIGDDVKIKRTAQDCFLTKHHQAIGQTGVITTLKTVQSEQVARVAVGNNSWIVRLRDIEKL